MKINLRSDAKKISDYVKQRVAEYPAYVNLGPGEDDDPITHMTLGYEFCQAGWVALVFDTRLDGSPDGEWQSYIEENSLEFPSWLKAIDALWDDGEPIEVTLPDGSKQKLGEDDDLGELIGIMLRDILIRGRKEKWFEKLPIAKKSCMGVEDHDGAFGWPDYDKRFKDGKLV